MTDFLLALFLVSLAMLPLPVAVYRMLLSWDDNYTMGDARK